MLRPRSVRRLTAGRSILLTVATLGAAASLLSHSASAAWPPPESATAADMADPANWPNDPSYGYSADSDGQWNYYSFMPDVATMVRAEEIASGMSIDLAWRHTIGDPSTLILVTDSGIKWDEDDLLDSAYINHLELANHKPTMADGSACGGTGELDGFDCNGDGVLTISDYAVTPTLEPPASDGHPQGDKNNNGKLDAGDLILNFSDGIDDDGNGYVDDISGWDFFKDDNDPYDDTRYGHGTGEARDSVSQTNNGIGSAGGCPKCRYIPARVGDSFITDVVDFGQAVMYAADHGASVVQCALGTISMTDFAQRSLDYAYERNVLVITSMADENARHHNMPAAANHTLPVHAIQHDGTNLKSSSTFVAFHPCSNFGGQNLLSASGNGCSSEATGQLSGIAGLVVSAGKQFGVSPPLTPGELHSIFFTTADDIDVPESQLEGSSYRWSQPGFDQRFGYGRVNANRAVEAVKAGRIPPAVDVTSPHWFEVLYKDQVTGPVDIVGTVSAKRANSYDYVVEWAPGVQPLDDQFQVFHEVSNLPPSTVAGVDGPLASIDIRTIDPTHPRDVDSPYGENDFTITVRVRAVAHYGGSIGDVPGEMRRTYYVYEDPDLLPGFPVFIGDSGEGSAKMADLDGDGADELVYATSGGFVHAWKMGSSGPSELPGFPFKTAFADGVANPALVPGKPVYAAPGYATVDVEHAREGFTNSPAIADLDGDGTLEIVLSTYPGTIYVIGTDGAVRDGWPLRLPEVPSCPLDPLEPKPDPCMDTVTRVARGAFASPVLEDLDGDGTLEIIQAAFDGKVYVFDHGGGADVLAAQKPGWPVQLHYPGTLAEAVEYNRILSTPAITDLNDDGVPDLVVGSNERLGAGQNAGAFYVLDGRGNDAPGGPVLPGWPVSMTSLQLFPLVAEGVPNSPVAGTFDGVKAAVMHGNASLPLIVPVDPGGQSQLTATPENAIPQRPDAYDPTVTQKGVDPSSKFGPLSDAPQPNTMLPLFAQPSLGDLDQDGTPDVIATGGSLNLAINLQSQSGTGLQGDNLVAVWSGKTGAMLPGAPFVLEDYTFFNSQAVVDVDGDQYPEVITGSGGYYLRAYDACGRQPAGWPKFTGQWIISTPALGDLDGDGQLEVSVATRSGWMYAWHTGGTKDGVAGWTSYHHDNRNTGNYDAPADFGVKNGTATPLTVEVCEALIGDGGGGAGGGGGDALTPGGGCSCRLDVGPTEGSTEGPGDTRGGLAALAAMGLALARRRRARA